MDLVEKIKTITYTACAAILTIVASICIFKLSNRACKVMDNFNGAIEGQLDKNGVPQDGLAGLVKKCNEVADGFKVVLNGEPDEQGALHGGLKDMVNNLNDAIGGRLDENKQPYGLLPFLQHVTKMVDGSEPAPNTIVGNVLVISKHGAQVIKKVDEVTDRVHENGIFKGMRMTRDDAEKAQKKQEERAQRTGKNKEQGRTFGFFNG